MDITLNPDETIDDIEKGRQYKNMMDSRWGGEDYNDWLKNIKLHNAKSTYKYKGKIFSKDYCDTEDYMYEVFDWHYKENKTQLKYDKLDGCARSFNCKEATAFKWRTLPKQFKDKGMTWLLMDITFNNVDKIKSQKSTIDTLIEEVEYLKDEVDTMKTQMETINEKLNMVLDNDTNNKIDKMKKEIEELQEYKNYREKMDRVNDKNIYDLE
tara:strand:- start:7 stop:639 length:633 start_codon:yes stop_codon:yes gene_type:complete